jgi:hypothetical protein
MAWYWWLLSAWGIFWVLWFAFGHTKFHQKLADTCKVLWDLLVWVADKVDQFNRWAMDKADHYNDIFFAIIDDIDLKISKKIGFKLHLSPLILVSSIPILFIFDWLSRTLAS